MKRANSCGRPQTTILISTKGICVIDDVTFCVTVKEYTDYFDYYTIKFSKNSVKIIEYYTDGTKKVKRFKIEKDIILKCESNRSPMCKIFDYFMYEQ